MLNIDQLIIRSFTVNNVNLVPYRFIMMQMILFLFLQEVTSSITKSVICSDKHLSMAVNNDLIIVAIIIEIGINQII